MGPSIFQVFIVVTIVLSLGYVLVWQKRSSTFKTKRHISVSPNTQDSCHISKHPLSVAQPHCHLSNRCYYSIPRLIQSKQNITKPWIIYMLPHNSWMGPGLRCGPYICNYIYNESALPTADAILWQWKIPKEIPDHPPGQLWIIQTAECFMLSQSYVRYGAHLNWSLTYRLDAAVPRPYGEWMEGCKAPAGASWMQPVPRNRSGIAWVASKRASANGRLNYVLALQNYTTVEIYGKISNRTCGTHNYDWQSNDDCFEKIITPKYKFYLAFENANCRHYITEKFWDNALSHSLVPIVMGPPYRDYKRVAPPGSFIHVDEFESPRQLADYLNLLERNDTLYQSYFAWKKKGSLKNADEVNTERYCWLCQAIHHTLDAGVVSYYKNYNEWWRGEGICSHLKTPDRPWGTWRGLNVSETVAADNTTFWAMRQSDKL